MTTRRLRTAAVVLLAALTLATAVPVREFLGQVRQIDTDPKIFDANVILKYAFVICYAACTQTASPNPPPQRYGVPPVGNLRFAPSLVQSLNVSSLADASSSGFGKECMQVGVFGCISPMFL